MRKYIFIFTFLFIFFAVSCQNESITSITTEHEITTKHMDENAAFLNEEPLKVLYIDTYWGDAVSPEDQMIYNRIQLSELCKNELGFPVDFIKLDEDNKKENAYALFIQSGQSADLIFPSKPTIVDISKPSKYYWGDEYIDDGVYMDLTPYIARFCPEVLLSFKRYPDIANMCVRNGKTYALYAGMPQISLWALIIKNKLLENSNLDLNKSVDFKSLFTFMTDTYQGHHPPSDYNKIFVDPLTLLKYITVNEGYYQMICNRGWNDILLKQDDNECVPYMIEDTVIFDSFFDEFSCFFSNSFFTNQMVSDGLFLNKQDMFITDNALKFIHSYSKTCIDEMDNIFKNYSIIIIDNQRRIVDRTDSIHLIMVPMTSTQPEKALLFIQFLMTNDKASDIMTYGSSIKKVSHYRYSADGTIIPEKWNTIYGFCNLIANFTDNAFLCGNKDFDIIKKYQELTFNALYPPFYKYIESQHVNHEQVIRFCRENRTFDYRRSYIENTIKKLISNAEFYSNAEIMKNELYNLQDNEKIMEQYKELINNIYKSGTS